MSGDWTMRAFKDEAIEKIRKQVGKGRVICGLSGGVDSAVAAVLIHEAIGEQLTCVFVDHGLLRLAEAREGRRRCSATATTFRWCTSTPSDMFLKALAGVDDPEQKRKTIGKLFIDVFDAEAKKIGGAEFLAQGTLYPGRDRERVVHRRAVGHHQVAPQCRRPARAHEDEAGRAVARTVQGRGEGARPRTGIAGGFRRPPSVPGAGAGDPHSRRDHAKRNCDILRLADEIYIEEIRRAGLYDDIWQAFAVLLPVKTVGVMGDGRTYDYVVGLRAVTSTDGMTADFYPFDMKFIGEVATRIINEVKGVNRVVYDVTSKPPGTIEWE